ncbi:hypothetical protein LCGC14_0323390 [marine sediment metagenome]|uniref:Uncharacterized protein n=1 Tax=marine sediment metagenome TaxID=412755 RepID=A0A0F9TIM6_9ZZZZ
MPEQVIAHSLDQVQGKPVEIEIGGKQYKASPLTLSDFGEIKVLIRKGWLLALNDCGIDQVELRHIRALTASRPVDMDVIAAEMSSPDIVPYVIWLALRKHNKITLKEITEATDDIGELANVVAAVSGMYAEGNGENPTPLSTGVTSTAS